MKNVRGDTPKPHHFVIKYAVLGLFVLLVLLGTYGFIMYLRKRSEVRNKVSYALSKTNSVLGESTPSYKLVASQHAYFSQAGQRFLRVSISLKNDSASTLQFSPLLQLVAVDAAEKNYPFTAIYTKNPLGGPVPASQSVNGDVDFLVGNALISSIKFTPTIGLPVQDILLK